MFIDFWQEIVDDGEKNKFGLKFRSRLYINSLQDRALSDLWAVKI